MIESTWRRLRRIWRSNVGDDVDDEMAFHTQMRIDQFMAAGMSRDAAARAARDQFGDAGEVRSTLVSIGSRRRRRLDLRDRVDAIVQDVVVSARGLRREPLFTAGVVITLGLGIGANATMFGIIDRLMLHGPSHVVDAQNVNRFYVTSRQGNGPVSTRTAVGYVTYATLRDHTKSFASVGAYTSGANGQLGGGAEATPIQVAYATWDLFPTLGVHPVIGRFFARDEDSPPRGVDLVVLSQETWESQFGGESSILGKSITVNNASYRVIGVAPRGFTGAELFRVDVWLPMTTLPPPITNWATSYKAQWLRIVTRLAPDVTRETASAEATRVLRLNYGGDDPGLRVLDATVHPLWFANNGQPSQVASVSRWLMGVAAVVLLVTCANIANLLLARARRRRREVAVRLALGAGRSRLVQLLLVETLIVVLGGAVAALGIASAGSRVMRATLLSSYAWDGNGVDARVLIFTVALAIVAGLATGLAPAITATRSSLVGALKASSGDGGGRRARARTVLTALQAGLCVVLLIGAGLFVESLQRSRAVDLGIQPSRIDRVYLDFQISGSKDERAAGRARTNATLLSTIDRLRRMPWVENAAISVGSPFGYSFSGIRLAVPGRDSISKLSKMDQFIAAVSPGYFETVGTPLHRGRTFTAGDRDGSAAVVIINETMAATIWPRENAVGKCIEIGDEPAPCAEVVGVVADVHRNSLREEPAMQYYVPFGQERGIGGSSLMVRTRGESAASIPALKRALQSMPDLPYATIASLQTVLDPQYRPWKLGAAMFGVFGVLALVIAAVGLYSVIAYLVADRTREIGVRIALGATDARIVRQVVGNGLAITGAGVVCGTVVAFFASRYIEPLLFDGGGRDPRVMIVVAMIVMIVGGFASWRPARRAARVDPIVALRSE